MRIKRYGWRADNPDVRDRVMTMPRGVKALPDRVDLRGAGLMPSPWDQGDLGSCTAHGIGLCYAYLHRKEGLGEFMPSRRFIYYNERVMENTVYADAGAAVRDGIKSISKGHYGVAPEEAWEYDVAQFAVEPPPTVYELAKKHVCVQYMRTTRDIDMMRSCLHGGFPFTFGFSVYDSFESDEVAKTGMVPMPHAHKESLVGGHCVTAMGYWHSKRLMLCQNSWGLDWGLEGCFWLPYGFFTNRRLSSDFWTLRLTEDC
jgi:C1A family cysteine protease